MYDNDEFKRLRSGLRVIACQAMITKEGKTKACSCFFTSQVILLQCEVSHSEAEHRRQAFAAVHHLSVSTALTIDLRTAAAGPPGSRSALIAFAAAEAV